MNLQISIPKKHPCVNKCPYCISKTHDTTKDAEFETLGLWDYMDELRMNILHNDYRTVVITGENEPFQQPQYVLRTLEVLRDFPWISVELTTTGYQLDKYIKSEKTLMNRIDVISLSTLGTAKCDLQVMKKDSKPFSKLAKLIKKKLKNTQTRVTVLESIFVSYDDVMKVIYDDNVDQITVKHLQGDNHWINRNKTKGVTHTLDKYFSTAIVSENDRFTVYNIAGKSVFVDKDCQTPSEETYHVMRSDGKIYSGWQTKTPLERRK